MNQPTREFWTEFLQMYQALPALWKVRSEAYKCRALKEQAYKVLIRKVREVYPTANRAFVVRKINTFRTNYRREKNKLQRGITNGRVRSKLWYYDSLKFLNSHDLDYAESSSMKLCTPDEEQEAEYVNEGMEAAVVKEHQESLDNVTCFKLQLRSPTPQSITQNSSQDKDLHTTFSELCAQNFEQNDEHMILAKAWACQYQKLDKRQKFLSQKLISDVLFHGYLGQLKSSHILDFQRVVCEETQNNDPLFYKKNGIV